MGDTAGRASWASCNEGRRMMPGGVFLESANDTTEETTSRKQALRKFPYSPLTQSNVDQVVFGENIDAGLFKPYMEMHDGAAGHPSWVERPKGLGCSSSRRRRREMKLRRTGRDLLARLLGPRSNNKTFAHIAPDASVVQQ